jgi:rhodanese-related sulfurtransferase
MMGRREREAILAAVVVCCIACVGRVSVATAGDAHDSPVRSKSRVADLLGSANWGSTLPGPLCGIYAACTAVELIGMEAKPRDFLMSKYVGNCGGSSPEEVARVVKDAGARADVLSNLSTFDLRLIECPLIANVRTSPNTNRFDHWVVAVPSATGMTIFDGLKKPYDIRTAEFLGIWSGIGICVTRYGPTPLVSIWLGRIPVFLTIVLVAVLVLRSQGSMARAGQSGIFKQISGLCLASLVLAILGNVIFGDLPHHGKGVAVATAASGVANYRSGTLDDAKNASASDGMLLVDARLETDYRLGTIKGAVNIPVSASVWEIDKYVEKLHRSTPIVVFCQSSSCGFDETVAAELTSLGFRNVTVCNEGWAEFQELAARVDRR